MATETTFGFDITDFPIEQAYWNAHKDELIQKYPNKYLVIRGEVVVFDVNDIEDLLALTEGELRHAPGFPCSTRPVEQVSLLLSAEAFWQANKDELERKHPAKRLIIRNDYVTAAVDTISQQAEKEEDEPDPNYVVRMTKGVVPSWAFTPYNFVDTRDNA
jgi:hypothetical protein